ncbi:hypothetical protein HYH03_002228 [Edaphochlamys debaryana]|uniref:Uncharacterized protein n=1 Tax=Edaphochlamys debaryana TaxID=47281 RepID=A0A835YFG9_9CHLO|nr:hypothetical protein HYH03_002228 [Edaphochlamys debaryana]|eukprot:KAG2499941.1 hypothetical protein HYH03_002228 [Edaphochlamys debaryana]
MALIWALSYAWKEVEVRNNVLVTKDGQDPVQVMNLRIRTDSRGRLVGAEKDSTKPSLLNTQPLLTQRALNSNMTTAELRSVKSIIVEATSGAQYAVRVTGYSSSLPSDGVRVVAFNTPSGVVMVRGEVVTLPPGASHLLLGPEGEPLEGIKGAMGIISL